MRRGVQVEAPLLQSKAKQMGCSVSKKGPDETNFAVLFYYQRMTDLQELDQRRARLSSADHVGHLTRSPRQSPRSRSQRLLRRACRTMHPSLTKPKNVTVSRVYSRSLHPQSAGF